MAPQEMTQFNPKTFVSKLLGAVSYKEKDVLERRFGLDKKLLSKGGKYSRKMKETLEEIGKSHNITRERVRQIEAAAIRKLKEVIASDVHQEDVKMAVEAIDALLAQYGEIMAEEHLVEAFFQNEGNLTESEEDQIIEKQSLLFLISQLLTDKFSQIKSDKQIVNAWKKRQADEDTLRQTVAEFEHIIDAQGVPQNFDELVAKFKDTPFYQTNKEQLHEQYLLASLRSAKNIKSNRFGEWGLTHWRTIVPKKTNDKIYLVLKKEGRPMHFTEIAEKINEIGFDHKNAYPATVHNELILDQNYVLVGRGIYALKEWGYTPGVVSDVIAEVIKQEGRPMDKDEIVEKVMSQRMVKKSTIYLSLMNKKKFKKVDGKYTLV